MVRRSAAQAVTSHTYTLDADSWSTTMKVGLKDNARSSALWMLLNESFRACGHSRRTAGKISTVCVPEDANAKMVKSPRGKRGRITQAIYKNAQYNQPQTPLEKTILMPPEKLRISASNPLATYFGLFLLLNAQSMLAHARRGLTRLIHIPTLSRRNMSSAIASEVATPHDTPGSATPVADVEVDASAEAGPSNGVRMSVIDKWLKPNGPPKGTSFGARKLGGEDDVWANNAW